MKSTRQNYRTAVGTVLAPRFEPPFEPFVHQAGHQGTSAPFQPRDGANERLLPQSHSECCFHLHIKCHRAGTPQAVFVMTNGKPEPDFRLPTALSATGQRPVP